jgi:hypothetical protein
LIRFEGLAKNDGGQGGNPTESKGQNEERRKRMSGD